MSSVETIVHRYSAIAESIYLWKVKTNQRINDLMKRGRSGSQGNVTQSTELNNKTTLKITNSINQELFGIVKQKVLLYPKKEQVSWLERLMNHMAIAMDVDAQLCRFFHFGLSTDFQVPDTANAKCCFELMPGTFHLNSRFVVIR